MKNAIIIGASSGIGKDLALILVENDYKVAITGRRLIELEKIKSINSSQFIIKQHDITNFEQTIKVFDELVQEMGNIDLVIHSSGIGEPNYQLDFAIDLPTINTNILGGTLLYGLAYNLFKKQGFGHLVGITSVASIRGNRHVPAYFASKSYQASYLESLWFKAQKSKLPIYVTDIQPGFVDTPMALGKTFWMATSQKAAQQIYKAILARKKKVYITKRWALVALAMKLAPSKLYAKLF
ncbi:MAG: SDR family NAD(P)-dependent oxidoreductase [Flavobacteriaceae bacterium]|nr:SDR family NAD(P)-dependent oxidoreductase [Flavobacteriaceae bacterium]